MTIETMATDNTLLPVIDQQLALKRANNQAKLAAELFSILIKTLAEDKDNLVLAYNNQQFNALREQLHKLYGATLYCGLPQLEAAVKALQIQIKADQPTVEISKSYQTLIGAIDNLLDQYQDTNPINAA